MCKFRFYIFITAMLCLTQQTAIAEEGMPTTIEQVEETTVVEESTPSNSTAKDILSEIIIRPVSVVASATGLALFIAASPFSGLASIPEPHDVFMKTWKDFVITPYYFAFRRPFGDYSTELY